MKILPARPRRAPTFGEARGPGTRAWAFAIALFLPACSAQARTEGLEPSSLPAAVRSDYAVFAQRCSKCHSLARPLNSGITDDNYWVLYVARMRRQPASGITQEDAGPILRFLNYYSLEQRKKGEKNEDEKNEGEKNEKNVPPAPSGSAASRAPSSVRM